MSKTTRRVPSTSPSSTSRDRSGPSLSPLDFPSLGGLGGAPGGGNAAVSSLLGLGGGGGAPRSWTSLFSSSSPSSAPVSGPSTSIGSPASSSGPSAAPRYPRASGRGDLWSSGGPFRGPHTYNDTGADGEEHPFLPLYHATASRYAPAIERGIDLGQSRPNLDFNPRGQGGFYTTADLGQAEEWAATQGSRFVGDRGVVLEYAVQEDLLNGLNGKRFDTSWQDNGRGGYNQRFPSYGDFQDWQDFVWDGRRGALDHDYDFVEGPMLANPRCAGPGDVRSKGHQLAGFTDEIVQLFEGPNTQRQRLDL